jgi:glycerol-3-phosphate dehydrogenase (NAD(P)+)
MVSEPLSIGVIGGGAWGTALAQVAAGGGDTLLWALEPEVVDSVNRDHENRLFLAGTPLDPAVRATGDLEALAGRDALLVVTPAQHMRRVLAAMPRLQIPLILCAKGMEEATMALMHDVAHEVQPDAPIAVLSGPTFAHEVAAGLPAAVTLAVADRALGERLRARIARPGFRPYLSDDVVGAEIGGAVKNVLAIACGVVEGRRLGLNARSALISRGFAEMTRFGLARGARAETLAGLSGLGRPRPHLLFRQLAQLQPRQGPGRRARCRGASRRPPHRGGRRPYRAGAGEGGTRSGRGHADRGGRLRPARGRGERRRGGGAPPGEAASGGRGLSPRHPGESRDPGREVTAGLPEIPAFAGITLSSAASKSQQIPLFSQSP